MPMTQEQLRAVRASLEAKQQEADALVRKESPTGEDLTRAEKLYDEADGLKKQLDDDAAEVADLDTRRKSLQGRSKSLQDWRTQPDPDGLPVGGGRAKGHDGSREGMSRGFSLTDWEEGGHVKLDPITREIVEESGPGVFGQKTWDVLRGVEYKREWIGYLRKGTRFLDRCKALQEGLDDQGGVLAPADMIMRLISRLAAPTMLRSHVQTITTGRDRLEMPRVQYSSDDKYSTGFRATWTGEIPSSESVHEVSTADLFGIVGIDIHTAMLSGALTKNVIEDAGFPLQSWFEGKLSETIDLLYEDMILNGSGIGQPIGVLNNPGASDRPEVVLSGTADSIDHALLIDLQTAVAPQYEGNARWVFNKKSTYRALNKLLDQQNRPLFTTGYNDSGLVPPRGKVLLGDPIALSQFMPNVGNGAYPIIYGDLRGYYLAQRIGFSLQVLDQTKAKLNQVEVVGRVRFGGKPVEHWRIKVGKSDNA